MRLDGNPVARVTALVALPRLREIGLVYTRVSDARPLAAMPALEQMDLSGTRVEDVAALTKAPRLVDLDLSDTSVTDLTRLSGIRTLRRLALRWAALDETQVSAVARRLRGVTVISDDTRPDRVPACGVEVAADAARAANDACPGVPPASQVPTHDPSRFARTVLAGFDCWTQAGDEVQGSIRGDYGFDRDHPELPAAANRGGTLVCAIDLDPDCAGEATAQIRFAGVAMEGDAHAAVAAGEVTRMRFTSERWASRATRGPVTITAAATIACSGGARLRYDDAFRVSFVWFE